MLRYSHRAAVLTLVITLSQPSLFAATRERERPDPEMLRMMEFLREMEMLQQIEMMREFEAIDDAREPQQNAGARKTPPAQKKGDPK
jgi:hypothetical protein